MRRTAVLLIVLAVVTVGGTVGCAKAKGSKEAFCKQVRQTPALATALAGYPTGDADTYAKDLREARNAFGDLQKAAPRSIRADVGAVGELVDDIVDAIEEHPDDPTAVAGQLRMDMMSSPSAAKAAINVSNYAATECNYSLMGVSPTVPLDGFEGPSSTSFPEELVPSTVPGG